MADKTVGMLENVPSIHDESLIPVEQSGELMHATGKQFREFAEQAASGYIDAANDAANRAEAARDSIVLDEQKISKAEKNAAASENKAKLYADQCEASVSGVASFNGRGGHVVPKANDYTPAQVGSMRVYRLLSELGLEEATATPETIVNAMEEFSMLIHSLGESTDIQLAPPRKFMLLTVIKRNNSYAEFTLRGSGSSKDSDDRIGFYGYYNTGAATPWSGWYRPPLRTGDTFTGNLIVEMDGFPAFVAKDTANNRSMQFRSDNGTAAVVNEDTGNSNNRSMLLLKKETQDLASILSLYNVKNGAGNGYNILHTGSKPRGSYTGNGSATARTISTGGIGRMAAIWCGDTASLAIVSSYGGTIYRQGTEVGALPSTACSFVDGVLTITSDHAVVNKSGAVYGYQVL